MVPAIINCVFGAVIFGISLWLSIRIICGYNSNNTIGTALLIGVVYTIAGAIGMGFALLLIIAMMYILIGHYNLGLIRSVVVIIFSAGIQYGVIRLATSWIVP